ncbi:nucleotidyltransferase family protein [Jannaschia aquimarina]|uniref:PucB protein n=1 Tax=Jannaschia aquimarina TaxID=935700 RepID=A0A0D1ENA1_9RHOB|nr:nucleotidyltransferase family protein [Jannaschia aquimarina]KIT17165.1 Purine catabolism protein PucB [Jannaschia aquimarina]SNT17645.1 CTP:molybdopterin cytidylyltransferase MocA [Jannaschia aquimarina]
MRPAPAILILAAGASSRMGDRDKLLETVDGTPLILRAARAACANSAEVIVTLPTGEMSRRAWLTDLPLRIVDVSNLAMSASIRAGVAVCAADAILIHLADMPEVGADDLATLIHAWQRSDAPILRATAQDGRPGQPVIFDRSLFPALSSLDGDRGAKALIAEMDAEQVPLPEERALTDLDTPAAWAEWRSRTGRPF